jgi:hypothetical protein
MKRFSVKGEYVKQLRESRERHATQKEFAHELGISERHLRSAFIARRCLSMMGHHRPVSLCCLLP